jgi:3-oxoacyl-[acyl-carrier-protein] synthase III
VVNGEYITHLTRTAQEEIASFLDPRLACLTLGDSGVAILLDRAPTADVGLQELELYTLGKYHELCVAKLSAGTGRGPIMLTDSVTSTAVTVRQAVGHAVEVLKRRQWGFDKVGGLIIHQTSETTLDGAMQEINRAIGQPVCHRGNTLFNVAERGNTATNTHFLALYESMRAGNFRPGDRVVFAVSGSGQTVGTALYVLDDLPDRVRAPLAPVVPVSVPAEPLRHFRCSRRVRIEAVGTTGAPGDVPADTIGLVRAAGERCLQQSKRPRGEIDLIIHTGVHRTDFLGEPAVAAIAAGVLGINHDDEQPRQRRTLAFDILNGAGGGLTASFLVCQMLAARRYSRALVLAAEVDHNRQYWPAQPLGLAEVASALVLEESASDEGFAAFGYRRFPEHVDALREYTGEHEGRPAVFHEQDSRWPSLVSECVDQVVREFLKQQGMDVQGIGLFVTPQSVADDFGGRIGVNPERVFRIEATADYYTSSLAYSFEAIRERGRGPILFIEVAAGLQVWCALYYPPSEVAHAGA